MKGLMARADRKYMKALKVVPLTVAVVGGVGLPMPALFEGYDAADLPVQNVYQHLEHFESASATKEVRP